MLPAELPQPVAPEDWRILRTLGIYRIVLVALLILLSQIGFTTYFLEAVNAPGFLRASLAYGIAAACLLPLSFFRGIGIRVQAYLGFGADAFSLIALIFATKGIGGGFGVLLITPAVGCSLILSTRTSMLLAATATMMLFGEEALRQSAGGFDGTATNEAGLLGLMLFVTSVTANAIAGRARKSEALATRVGIDLRNLAQLNERIVESMGTGVLVLDEERCIHLVNLAGRRLLGIVRGREGVPLAQDYPEIAAALERWEQNSHLDSEPLTPRGGTSAVIPRFMRLGWNSAAPVLILLDDAARVSEQAQQIKLAALGRLSASIAHEIRNPLSAIHHASQLLAESASLDPADQRLLDMVQRHSVRIDRIVQSVMGLSRRAPPVPASLNLRDFLERCLALYHEANPHEKRHIEIDECPADWTIRFDPGHLQQILHNLWDNSFAHGGKGAGAKTLEIHLSADRLTPRGPIFLDVRDNGSGIPKAQADKIFEPFFTTSASGTGLGLYLARELCDYNHGRLDYLHQRVDGQADPQAGACFRLSFAS